MRGRIQGGGGGMLYPGPRFAKSGTLSYRVESVIILSSRRIVNLEVEKGSSIEGFVECLSWCLQMEKLWAQSAAGCATHWK